MEFEKAARTLFQMKGPTCLLFLGRTELILHIPTEQPLPYNGNGLAHVAAPYELRGGATKVIATVADKISGGYEIESRAQITYSHFRLGSGITYGTCFLKLYPTMNRNAHLAVKTTIELGSA